MAINGKGEYFTVSDSSGLADSLRDAFESIFTRTRASFSSVVVPGGQIGAGNGFYNSFFLSSDAAVCIAGSRTMTLVPTPTSLVTSIRPP